MIKNVLLQQTNGVRSCIDALVIYRAEEAAGVRSCIATFQFGT